VKRLPYGPISGETPEENARVRRKFNEPRRRGSSGFEHNKVFSAGSGRLELRVKRLFLSAVISLLAACSFAGTISVNSPATGTAADPTLVGANTSITFALTAMVNVAKINITVFRQSDNTIFFQALDATRVTPSTTNHDGSGSYNLTFTEGTPEVVYRVEVRAVDLNGATTYNTDQNLFVKPDVTKPKFLSFNPVDGSFVKGIVPIRVKIKETNLQDWRVQIGGQDIPNNTGTTVSATGEFVVNWDTTGILLDGPRTINVRVRDLASNEENININVQIDRVAPTVTIRAPVNNTTFSAGTTIVITVDIRDASSTSVNASGVDVVVKRMDGTFITRAARISFSAIDGSTVRWNGRIRWVSGQLPSQFKIVVTAVDRAGNVAPTPQSVTVRIGS
jgi:hypothetical protein